ncbi:MAG: flagellar motor protein MotB [Spongiibacteraceae bacterium]|jgi:chemotaxis protein MotB|nr:flagellar motor protein MotB [Spongiibacteraceae bacterium]
MQDSHGETVVVKRGRRGRDREEKGGAWKVAFADFTMALMALFLVLWLLSVSEIEERQAMAESLRNYSVLDGGPSPFDLRSSPYPIDLGGAPHSTGSEESSPDGEGGTESGADGLHGMLESPQQMALLGSQIEQLAAALAAEDNLTVELVPQGLRISIRDDQQRQMFARGSHRLEPFFHELLMRLAPVFGRVENALIISGHTDTVPYTTSRYTNWELSGNRALTARRVLEGGGMPGNRVAQVVAFSDRILADRERPDASANRRIEILLLTSAAQAQLFELFDPASRPR